MRRTLLASPAAQRNLMLAALLAPAAACWVLLLAGEPGADMSMAGPSIGRGAALFLTLWLVMMAAMMLPAAAPMILTYHRIQSGRRDRGERSVSTWLFVAGYLAVWGGAGVAAYLGAVAVEAVAARTGISAATAERAGGGLILAAGLYQLTPLKDVCLAKCRSPLAFIVTSWRDGPAGALRMGFLHGLFCLGCCWLLFLILFPLGLMNTAAMALLTLVVLAEKSLAWRRTAVYATAAALVAYGATVIAVPQALPAAAMPGMAAIGTKMPLAPSNAMPGMHMPAAPALDRVKIDPAGGNPPARP